MERIEIVPGSIQIIKMTDEEYFSDKYKDYISNSRLGLINPDQGGSVELYKTGISSGYSDSFELGSIVHGVLLQPERYTISDIRKPSGKLGQFADKMYKYSKEGMSFNDAVNKASIDADYYAGKLTEKRLTTAVESCTPYWVQRKEREKEIINLETDKSTLYISEAMAQKFECCLTGIDNEPRIKSLLCPQGILEAAETYNEYAIFAEVDITIDGVVTRKKVKAKLDNYTVNHETEEVTLNDLKTTGKPIGFFMGNLVKIDGQEDKVWYDGSFQHFHYYRQMGMYLWLLNCAMHFNKGIDYKLKVNMLVVETTGEFKSRVYSVSKKQIQQGLDEFKKLMILVVKNG